ncbi:MAG: transposase [Nitrospirota bacterium]
MPRQARLDFPGTLHHVIVRGIEKRKIVSDNTDRKSFISRLGKVATETGTIVYAWALMTNHAHILLQSGKEGISQFMRRLLTGYAVTYNLRHDRYGHLFQNRYKSIICDEEAYLLELVRYIHLNPVRAGVIKSMAELDRYRYCGHSVLMGKVVHEWQDRDYILRQFGRKEGEAKKRYREFVEAGIKEGRRPELVGGGLVRSQGGWSQVLTLRRKGKREMSDERVLGSGAFVERILQEAEERVRQQFRSLNSSKNIEDTIRAFCRKEGISQVELQGGSRRGRIPEVRTKIALKLVKEDGVIMAEAARHLGVSTSALSKAMK